METKLVANCSKLLTLIFLRISTRITQQLRCQKTLSPRCSATICCRPKPFKNTSWPTHWNIL